MTPAQLYDHLEGRLFEVAAARAVSPWRHGAAMLAEALGAEVSVMAEGTRALDAVFAQVVTCPRDPRRFVLPPAGRESGRRAAAGAAAPTPCVLLRVDHDPDGPGGGAYRGDDLVAWSLRPGSRRVWRWTAACAYLGELRPDADGVTRLWQDPHAWLRRRLKAAAHDRRAREDRAAAFEAGVARARARSGVASFAAAKALPEGDGGRAAYLRGFGAALRAAEAAEGRWTVERRMADGALVLDPAAIAWTRAGVLAEAEAVEICDAPWDGPLGRALMQVNPRLGTARGIPLRGVAPARRAGVGRAA